MRVCVGAGGAGGRQVTDGCDSDVCVMSGRERQRDRECVCNQTKLQLHQRENKLNNPNYPHTHTHSHTHTHLTDALHVLPNIEKRERAAAARAKVSEARCVLVRMLV